MLFHNYIILSIFTFCLRFRKKSIFSFERKKRFWKLRQYISKMKDSQCPYFAQEHVHKVSYLQKLHLYVDCFKWEILEIKSYNKRRYKCHQYICFTLSDFQFWNNWLCKRSHEIINESYFCVRHKNRQKHNQHFKTAVFTINLHFVKLKQMSTYRKLNLPLTSSIFCLPTCRNAKKTCTDPSIPLVFLLYWKERTFKPLKVAAAKTLFSSVYAIDTNCFDECFLFFVIAGRHYFSWKFIVTVRLLNCHVAAFFEASVLKKVHILCVISKITIWC